MSLVWSNVLCLLLESDLEAGLRRRRRPEEAQIARGGVTYVQRTLNFVENCQNISFCHAEEITR